MVSDHGEPLGYGEHGHGIMRKIRPWPYEELVHTPLIIRGPGLPAGKRVSAFVQSCDVAPTVCDWLGIGVHPDMDGFSLLPLARGEVEKVRDFVIAGYFKAGWAIYTEDWSYVHWPLHDKGTMAFNEDAQGNIDTQMDAIGQKFNSMADTESLGSGKSDALGGASDALARHKAGATLDGEDQWTCTPGAAYITPEEDELYDRRTDPFQLTNVIKEHPDVATDLLTILRGFIAGLQKKHGA